MKKRFQFLRTFFAFFLSLFAGSKSTYQNTHAEANRERVANQRVSLQDYANRFLLPTKPRDVKKWEKRCANVKRRNLLRRGCSIYTHEGQDIIALNIKNAVRKFGNMGINFVPSVA